MLAVKKVKLATLQRPSVVVGWARADSPTGGAGGSLVKLSSDKSYSLIPGLTICKRRKKMKDWKIAWNYYVI